jgi:hypothetical protein
MLCQNVEIAAGRLAMGVRVSGDRVQPGIAYIMTAGR